MLADAVELAICTAKVFVPENEFIIVCNVNGPSIAGAPLGGFVMLVHVPATKAGAVVLYINTWAMLSPVEALMNGISILNFNLEVDSVGVIVKEHNKVPVPTGGGVLPFKKAVESVMGELFSFSQTLIILFRIALAGFIS